jgi:hypothetical protein
VGQGASVAGSSSHLRAFSTSGALSGQGASVEGYVNRGNGPVTHSTSGALSGQGASVAGLANRHHEFVTSGVLSGSDSIVVGSAFIQTSSTHDSSGDLLGSGSELTGQSNYSGLSDSAKLDLILDILSNRQTLDPVTGMYTLYADDGVTVLKVAYAWEDVAGTIPFRGRGLKRLDAMM